MLEQEAPVALDEIEHRGERLLLLAGRLQLLGERFEAREEERSQHACLVAEELVDGGGRGAGLAREAPRGEHVETLAREQAQSRLEHMLGELCGAKLLPGHARMVERETQLEQCSDTMFHLMLARATTTSGGGCARGAVR